MSSKHFSVRISYAGMPLGFMYPDICEIDLTCTFPYAICLIFMFRMIFYVYSGTEPAVIAKVWTQIMLF
jgi:hypothetical protein